MCSHEYGSQQVELEVSQDEEEPKEEENGKGRSKISNDVKHVLVLFLQQRKVKIWRPSD